MFGGVHRGCFFYHVGGLFFHLGSGMDLSFTMLVDLFFTWNVPGEGCVWILYPPRFGVLVDSVFWDHLSNGC